MHVLNGCLPFYEITEETKNVQIKVNRQNETVVKNIFFKIC